MSVNNLGLVRNRVRASIRLAVSDVSVQEDSSSINLEGSVPIITNVPTIVIANMAVKYVKKSITL